MTGEPVVAPPEGDPGVAAAAPGYIAFTSFLNVAVLRDVVGKDPLVHDGGGQLRRRHVAQAERVAHLVDDHLLPDEVRLRRERVRVQVEVRPRVGAARLGARLVVGGAPVVLVVDHVDVDLRRIRRGRVRPDQGRRPVPSERAGVDRRAVDVGRRGRHESVRQREDLPRRVRVRAAERRLAVRRCRASGSATAPAASAAATRTPRRFELRGLSTAGPPVRRRGARDRGRRAGRGRRWSR